ncbi:MAG: hypothetical protein V3V62_01165, partial [bacterium]
AAWAREELGRLAGPGLLVANKMDLPGARLPGEGAGGAPPLGISALRGDGIGALREEIVRSLTGEAGESGPGGQALLTRERHRDLVVRCREAVDEARAALAGGVSPELAAVHLNEAQAALSDLLGRSYGEALLDKIFATFCIGK